MCGGGGGGGEWGLFRVCYVLLRLSGLRHSGRAFARRRDADVQDVLSWVEEASGGEVAFSLTLIVSKSKSKFIKDERLQYNTITTTITIH